MRMLDYVLAGIVLVFIVVVLIMLRKSERRR